MQSCLTTVVENLHAVSHVKQNLPTKLQYCRDFGTIFRESVKKITKWSAFYFTKVSSYYPVPENSVRLLSISSLEKPDQITVSRDNLNQLYERANTHGKCVRQRTVRQETTAYKYGTLFLNMYQMSNQTGTLIEIHHEPTMEGKQNIRFKRIRRMNMTQIHQITIMTTMIPILKMHITNKKTTKQTILQFLNLVSWLIETYLDPVETS